MDSSEIKISSYEPKWEASHQVFARQYFHNRRKRVNADYIYWKFRGKPDGLPPSFLLAIHNNEVVGQLGLVPATIRLKKELYEAHWACDLMVSNDYRGQGIAAMLYEEASKMKTTLGSDPSPAAAKSMERFGFKSMSGPLKLFFPLKLDVISDMKFRRLSFIMKHFSNPFIYWIKLQGFLSIKPKIKLTQATIADINWSWLLKMKQSEIPMVSHDKDFLSWRLSSLEGYHDAGLIFQEENEYFLACRISSTSCYIGEFVFSDLTTAKRVLKELILLMRKRRIREIRWMANIIGESEMLVQLGFLKFRTRTNIIYYSLNEGFNKNIEGELQFYYTYLDSDENI